AYRNADGKEKFADGSGTVVIPETKNKIPDILDECRYELDFMQKMRVAEDEPTWGDYAGLYYHAVKDHKWTGLAVRPWDYESEWKTVRIVRPPTFSATLNYAACAAQAARLWAEYDADYASQLLQSAKEAYAAYKQHLYTPDRDENVKDGSLYAPLSYGYYGERDTQINDDAYWAACELYISAKALEDSAAADYLKDLSESAYAFDVPTKVSGGDNKSGEGSYTCFNMGNPAAAGSLSLALHRDLISAEQTKKLEDAIRKTADEYIKTEAAQGYGIPYENDSYCYCDGASPFDYNPIGFEYGSNAMSVYNMIAMAYAYDLTDDAKYMNGISTGMDYLLGNNPMAFSYVTGYGRYGVEKPVHRYWCHELDKTLPKAPDGILVGGPDASTMDEYMRAIGFVQNEYDNKSERCYADSVEAWASNGIALQWNAPFAWIVSFLQDEVPDMPVPVTATDPAETTEPPVQTTAPGSMTETPSNVSKWGDITCDNSLDVADAVLLARFLTQDAEAAITDQGILNANVVSGPLDSDDITALLLCIAKQIQYEQFPLAKLPAVRG
ncbi:MAG: glycoside hydrolase family 9 protein, partial [Oscillospiraceae bacterium]|nr:glycoside hydrolase family 9 protein [Oscillospiraceae bacterium]